MADPTLFTAHIAQGLDRLLTQFKGQPNFEGLLSAFLAQVQDVETMLYALIVERYLDTAVGAQLDGIGRVVGELRLGANNDDYRTSIRGRIRSNRGDSRVEDIYFLFTLLLPGSTFRQQDGPGPAAFQFQIVTPLLPAPPALPSPSPEVLAAQLRAAKGGGIHASMLFSQFDEANTFTTADGAFLQPDNNRGTGDGPPSTVGGFLSGVR